MQQIILNGMGEFSLKNAKKHPELVIDYLKALEKEKYLLKTMQYTHVIRLVGDVKQNWFGV